MPLGYSCLLRAHALGSNGSSSIYSGGTPASSAGNGQSDGWQGAAEEQAASGDAEGRLEKTKMEEASHFLDLV